MATGCLAGAEADIRRLSIVREMLAASVEMQASGLQDVQRLSAELQERHREVSAQMLELSLEMEVQLPMTVPCGVSHGVWVWGIGRDSVYSRERVSHRRADTGGGGGAAE